MKFAHIRSFEQLSLPSTALVRYTQWTHNALYCEDDVEGIDLDVEDRKQQIRDRLQKAKDAVQVFGGDGELPSWPQSGEDA
jgi:hypothetical protein